MHSLDGERYKLKAASCGLNSLETRLATLNLYSKG